MYIYIYIHNVYIYIYVYLVRHGNRQNVFFFCMVSVVDNIQRYFMVSIVVLFMVSVVAGNVLYSFRRWFFMVSVVAGKHFLMDSVAGLLVDSAAAGGSIILQRIERFFVFCVFRTGFCRWFFNGFRRGWKTFCMVSVA